MTDHNQIVVSDTITENAAGPKKAKGDQGELEQHALKDQVEADRYLKNLEPARRSTSFMQRICILPPGLA